MLSYLDFTQRFGQYLFNIEFQTFIKDTFNDLTTYNVSVSDYIISDSAGIELGFSNNSAVFDEDEEIVFEKGYPLFSHLNIYPKAILLFNELPFKLSFIDKRDNVHNKAGQPTKITQGDFLGNPFLIDHYRVEDSVVSIDYKIDDLSIKHIQIRDNNLIEHLKL